MTRVTSREYKLILSAGRFEGPGRRRGCAIRDLIKLLMRDSEFDDKDKVETRRTWYLDTVGFDLRKANYALRVRYEKDDKEYKTTLKHRSPDRYISAAQNVDSPATDDKAKFEEDILPRFRSVFSKSNSVKSKSEHKLKKVQDAIALFPGLKELGLQASSELGKVNGFEAHEKFCKLCKLRIPKLARHQGRAQLLVSHGQRPLAADRGMRLRLRPRRGRAPGTRRTRSIRISRSRPSRRPGSCSWRCRTSRAGSIWMAPRRPAMSMRV